MGKFNWKAKPTDDPRWRGGHRHYWSLWTISNLILISLVVLTVVEDNLLRKWLEEEPKHPFAKSQEQFWWRIGLALLPHAFFTLIQIWALSTQNWHPITALVFSIGLLSLWGVVSFFNAVAAYSLEYSFPNIDAWENLCYAEAGLQGSIAFCHLIMIGFAARAIHVWRKSRGARYTNVEMDVGKPSGSFEYSHDATARV